MWNEKKRRIEAMPTLWSSKNDERSQVDVARIYCCIAKSKWFIVAPKRRKKGGHKLMTAK